MTSKPKADDLKDDSKSSSMINMALSGMPSLVKTVMFSILSIPISLAVSALILQINIGSVIEKVIDIRLEEKEIKLEMLRREAYRSKGHGHGKGAAELRQMKRWICAHQSENTPEFCYEL